MGREVSDASTHSVDGLLRRIVRIAASSTGARYAAIGVIGADDHNRLSTFITHGLSSAERAQLVSSPAGRGLLGALIDAPVPVRVSDIGADPRSAGLPPGHPPMRSLLGVPIRAHGSVFGNLYLTEKEGGGDFTDADEAVAVALAATAGVAIEGARHLEDSSERDRWRTAGADTTLAVLAAADLDDAHQAFAEHARAVADADAVRVLALGGATPLLLAGAGWPDTLEVLDRDQSGWLTLEGVLGASELGPVAVEHVGVVVAVPFGGGASAGILLLVWDLERADEAEQLDLALARAFAARGAEALEESRLIAQRRRAAVHDERDRIGRDLHDFVIQRLFAVGLDLKRSLRADQAVEVARRVDQVVVEIDETIREIRRTVFDLANVPGSEDVQSEVTRLAARAEASLKFRPVLTFEGPVRLRVPGELVPDVVAVVGEALANVSRHARAHEVEVLLKVDHDDLVVRVSDDGIGIPARARHSGLANLAVRASNRGGDFRFGANSPRGTVLEWRVPLL